MFFSQALLNFRRTEYATKQHVPKMYDIERSHTEILVRQYLWPN